MELRTRLEQAAVVMAVNGEEVPVLPLEQELALAGEWGVSAGNIQRWAARWGIMPARYLRNYGTVGLSGQKRLLEAVVAVAGAGGLGGLVLELLARMGVGFILVADDDAFADSNLNRQLLATENNLGRNKAREAARRIQGINSGVLVGVAEMRLDQHNALDFLAPAQVLVDALDNLPGRFALQEAAERMGVPLVHGAIAGFQGQILTIFPGDPGLETIYGSPEGARERGVEAELGNPAATPAMVAAWQVQEVVKVLLRQGEPLRGRMLYLDAWCGEAQVLQLGPRES